LSFVGILFILPLQCLHWKDRNAKLYNKQNGKSGLLTSGKIKPIIVCYLFLKILIIEDFFLPAIYLPE